MVNDVSGLADPALARLCAARGAALVITHTRVKPKLKDYADMPDVVRDVIAFLAERSTLARELGVGEDQLLLDPGLDLGKRVGESTEILRRLPTLEALGRPLLLAISRKDFVGRDHRAQAGRARCRHAWGDRAGAGPPGRGAPRA